MIRICSGSRVAGQPLADALVASAESPLRQTALHNALSFWAADDLTAADGWAQGLPESVARQTAYAAIAKVMSGRSVLETVAWLDQLPMSSSRDHAVGTFAGTVLPLDPEAALNWLRTIPDESRRLEQLQSAWQVWAGRDFERADQWRHGATVLTTVERAQLGKK